MAAVHASTAYHTKSVVLATNAQTALYTCGNESELAFEVTGISVAATSAFADTCTIERYSIIDSATYTLVYRGPVEADYPLQLEGLPVHMVPGDIIYATATAGVTHALHAHISGIKTTRTPDRAAATRK